MLVILSVSIELLSTIRKSLVESTKSQMNEQESGKIVFILKDHGIAREIITGFLVKNTIDLRCIVLNVAWTVFLFHKDDLR